MSVFLILMIKSKNPYAHMETSMDPNGLRGIKKKAAKSQAAEQDVHSNPVEISEEDDDTIRETSNSSLID